MAPRAESRGIARVHPRIGAFFASRGWSVFEFQRRAWSAYRAGDSGLIHAPTGLGKTLAAFFGPAGEALELRDGAGGSGLIAPGRGKRGQRDAADPLTVLWVTPMRALANDSVESLQQAAMGVGLPWSIEKRTGDTSSSLRLKQKERLPTVLVTTPESLTLLLSYEGGMSRLGAARCVVVDEWHELLGTKRGVQTELALARLRTANPAIRTWGLSATLGNLDEAMHALTGARRETPGLLITGEHPKSVTVETLIPEDIERFPWAGHLGTRVLPQVLAAIDRCPGATLLFCNTRSQAEIWFRRLIESREDFLGAVAIHHGSLDKRVRAEVERLLAAGKLRCVVCTSSLDLGVDFSPVDQVIQIGSPRGVARLIQRAGRSGHRPGADSRVLCAPTHALELCEFAAARDAVRAMSLESRRPLNAPIDVLVQHLVTVACGGGFIEADLKHEVRGTRAFQSMTDEQWSWAMDFVRRGGPTLKAYPNFARVRAQSEDEPRPHGAHGEEEAEKSGEEGGAVPASTLACPPCLRGSSPPPRWVVSSPQAARLHRLNIGTIASDTSMAVRWMSGGVIGSIEESFIARLTVGDRFVFAGKVLELARVREMTAWVRRARRRSGAIPRWSGGRMPLSSQLAAAIRARLDAARCGDFEGPEMQAIRPVLELQLRVSRLPSPDELLVETLRTRDGWHVFVYPFHGRAVHEGLAPLLAHRITRDRPATVTASMTDYGVELLAAQDLALDEPALRRLLSTENLLADVLSCVNASTLARRAFRDIARVAGLILQGYPGAKKPGRHVQASSEMFFDVFSEFDAGNLLLDQARREVLESQLEFSRLRECLTTISTQRIAIVPLEELSPLAFPIWAERLRETHHSSEQWADRVAQMALRLEESIDDEGAARAGRRRKERAAKAEARTKPARRRR